MHDHGDISSYGGGFCVGCGVRDYQFVALRILHIDRYRTVVLTWKCREMQGQTGHSPYPVSLCNWHSRPPSASRLRPSAHPLSAAPNPRDPFHLTQLVRILGYAHSCMHKCSSWNITPVCSSRNICTYNRKSPVCSSRNILALCSNWNILYIQCFAPRASAPRVTLVERARRAPLRLRNLRARLSPRLGHQRFPRRLRHPPRQRLPVRGRL